MAGTKGRQLWFVPPFLNVLAPTPLWKPQAERRVNGLPCVIQSVFCSIAHPFSGPKQGDPVPNGTM